MYVLTALSGVYVQRPRTFSFNNASLAGFVIFGTIVGGSDTFLSAIVALLMSGSIILWSDASISGDEECYFVPRKRAIFSNFPFSRSCQSSSLP